MALETLFLPSKGGETHVYHPTEKGKSTAILDFLKLAFIAYCDEEERGGKIYVVQKKIIKTKDGQLFFPRKLDLDQHLAAEVPMAGEIEKPVFHRKAGAGILLFRHNHPFVSLN